MAIIPLIGFFDTLQEALSVRNSPLIDPRLTRYDAIQLLPNNTLPYVQRTANPNGVELEDWTVEVYTICGELKGDISDYFTCQPFDNYLGIAQIEWKLTNVPLDCGHRLVYLRASQTAGEDYFSTPFLLTNNEAEKTIRVDYAYSMSQVQSIQVKAAYYWTTNADSINSYEEAATKYLRSHTVGRVRPDVYRTDFWSNEFWGKMMDVLESRYVYVNLVRQSLVPTPEIPQPLGATNFAEGEFQLVPIPTDVYDPLYVPEVPPVPEPGDTVTITLTGQKQVRVGSTIYRVSLKIPITLDLENLMNGFSTLTLNGQVIPLGTTPSVVSGGFINVLWPGTSQVVSPGSVEVSSFTLRMSNSDSDMIEYVYSGPTVIFNPSEIANSVSKNVEAVINDI